MRRSTILSVSAIVALGCAAACSAEQADELSNDVEATDPAGDEVCDPAVETDCAQDARGRWRRRRDAGVTVVDSGSNSPPPVVDSGTQTPPVVDSGVVVTPPPSVQPTLVQDFNPWSGNVSPDGIWRIAGTWVGTGGNTLVPTNATLLTSAGGANGVLQLISEANNLRGSEIQTVKTYGYGYYETRMKVSATPGICDSFFWMEGTVTNGNTSGYGPHEWDVEFLTNESWITSANSGKVHYTLHYQDGSYDAFVLDLPFNPSKEFHNYGFLWKPGTITFTVDGQASHTFNSAKITTTANGFIMMNSWTGNPNWGGGPPKATATTLYDWVKFTNGVTAIP